MRKKLLAQVLTLALAFGILTLPAPAQTDSGVSGNDGIMTTGISGGSWNDH